MSRCTPPSPAAVLQVALCATVPGVVGAEFAEWDLPSDARRSGAATPDRLVPVRRPVGQNPSGVVCGVLSHSFAGHPDPVRRVWIAGDADRSLGAVSEPECRRIIAAFDLAAEEGLPVEWVAVSAGARISMESGTENMDWCAAVMRRILQFTQAGGEVVIIVAGPNVGAQSYWNSAATMLMHCAGLLVMCRESAMVLTGRRALAQSGGVSASDDASLGGYDHVMGPNGQAHHVAADLIEAYRIVLTHHELLARPGAIRSTADPVDRDVCLSKYSDSVGFTHVGELLDHAHNPSRKQTFAIRPVMAALADADAARLERWPDQWGADGAVVWDTRIGGRAVSLIGIESQHRRDPDGAGPGEGQAWWSAGTLYPDASRKVARAITHASGRRPVVVLANLAGFDGSAWSLRHRQLEFGAEIARAVMNFRGMIVVVVVGRFHGGAYVVFNKSLNPDLRMLALSGTKVSVIGGSAAAAVVLTRQVADRVLELATGSSTDTDVAHRAHREVAAAFDERHDVERAYAVGSVDKVIPPSQLRPAVIAELDSVASGEEAHGIHASATLRK